MFCSNKTFRSYFYLKFTVQWNLLKGKLLSKDGMTIVFSKVSIFLKNQTKHRKNSKTQTNKPNQNKTPHQNKVIPIYAYFFSFWTLVSKFDFFIIYYYYILYRMPAHIVYHDYKYYVLLLFNEECSLIWREKKHISFWFLAYVHTAKDGTVNLTWVKWPLY